MYYEHIATLTRDHARTHLRAYLDEINENSPTKVKLILPHSFDVSSVLGGVMGVDRSTLPAMAIDAFSKSLAASEDNVWMWLYNGQISCLVGGDSAPAVEITSRRYAAAMERFITDHQRDPFPDNYDHTTYPFRIAGLGMSQTDLFGAANVIEDGHSIWVDGFRIDITWQVIEEGPGQHG